jgi:hypothetical protein
MLGRGASVLRRVRVGLARDAVGRVPVPNQLRNMFDQQLGTREYPENQNEDEQVTEEATNHGADGG